jgi:hypothetical protein
MSKYTTQVRYICEEKAGLSASSDDYNQVIYAAYNKIIHPETALFDPNYKSVLYPKILRHYYFDEIAHETVGHWIMRLNTKLDEILPYYNQLYNSELLEFNPFYDVDYTIQGNREDNNTDKHTRKDNLSSKRTDNLSNKRTDNLTNTRTDNLQQNADTTNWNLHSDTPQASVNEIGLTGNIYLSDATKSTGNANTKNTGTQTTKDSGTQIVDNTGTQTVDNTGTQTNDTIIHNLNEYIETVKGKRGGVSYSSLLKEFRESFLNIDMMVIEELKNLFMQVY